MGGARRGHYGLRAAQHSGKGESIVGWKRQALAVGQQARHLLRIALRQALGFVQRTQDARRFATTEVAATHLEMDELATASRANTFRRALVRLQLILFQCFSSAE